jgi:hypothetical protein
VKEILFYIFIVIVGGFSLYLFTRLVSYAILQSIEDIKRKRKEKGNGDKN